MHDNPVSEQTDNVLFGTEGDGALSASKSPERPSAQSRESEKEVFDTDSTTFDTALYRANGQIQLTHSSRQEPGPGALAVLQLVAYGRGGRGGRAGGHRRRR